MTQPVIFHITAPRRASLGAKIVLNMELKNNTEVPAYFNARFAVVPGTGEVWLTIRHKDREIPFAWMVKMKPIRNTDFILLEPYESIVAGFQLTRGYELTHPGEYEISAEYVNETIPPELSKERVFTGHVQAPPVTLVLE